MAYTATRFIYRRPNGWRLSGEGGEADRVRCSRGLGADITFSLPNVT